MNSRDLILAALFCAVCAPSSSADGCLPPVFYTSLPRDADWHYGAGRSADTELARDEAVKNLGKQVTGAADGWDPRQIESIVGPGRVQRDADAAIGSALERTPLAGWEQDDFRRCEGLSYVLVRIEKSKALTFLKENAAFRSALAARLENRVAGVEAAQDKQAQRVATLEGAVRGLTTMLEERDAAALKGAESWGAGARRALKKDADACGQGEKTSCYSLGARYLTGRGVPQDKSKAQRYFRKACDHGDPAGCSALGATYDDGSGAEDLRLQAVELFEKACGLDDGNGCARLASMYSQGHGVDRDEVKAMGLFRKACDLDDGGGCEGLGFMYEGGRGGVSGDRMKRLKASVEFRRKACDLNDGGGCTRLGEMYRYGMPLTKDTSKAVELFTKACGFGWGAGCETLGEMYVWGEGLRPDMAKILEFYGKACDLNTRDACGRLAGIYLRPWGVPQDLTKGAEYFRKSCDTYNCYGGPSRNEVQRSWPSILQGAN